MTDGENSVQKTIVRQVCAELGIEPREFHQRSKLVQWGVSRWTSELQEPGWPQRFSEAFDAEQKQVAEQRKQAIELRVRHALRHGPEALAALSATELLSRIDVKLRPLAEGLRPEQGGRLICGPTGTGKTTALAVVTRRIVIDAVEHPDPTRPSSAWVGWARAADLPVARLGHGLGQGEPERVAHARECPVLCLDDLGWESRRAGADDVIAEVIAYRYDTGRVTWATTGLRQEQVVERYGEAFLRRILEAGGKPGKVINLWPRGAR